MLNWNRSVSRKASPEKAVKKNLGLQEIGGCNNVNREGDVIFVHGLGGNARSTWQPEEPQDDKFWLNWLSQDLENVGIWSFGYEAEPFDWKGKAMPLFDQASNLLEWIDSKGIGKKPAIFVTHSLGGLLVKEMIRTAQTFNRQKIIEQIKGIVFLATPHTGSHLANLIDCVGALTRTTVSVEELKAHAPELRELNEWYRENVHDFGVATKVFYETRSVHGILVVDADSANPGINGVKPVAIAKDHISIAKPDSREDLIYLSVKRFILESFQLSRKSIWGDIEDWDEELKQLLNTLYIQKQVTKQLITRADLFCTLIRSRIDMFDSTQKPRVSVMLDDFEQRLNSQPSVTELEITDSVKELFSNAQMRAKEDGTGDLGVLFLIERLLEAPGNNILKGLQKHGFSIDNIRSGVKYLSPNDLF